MRKFLILNCLVDCNDSDLFPNDVIQNLRQVVISPITYTPKIQEALQRINFKYHRTCSYTNILRECDVDESQTLLMFWGTGRSDSKVTLSMSNDSCTSLHIPASAPNSNRDRELRSTAQQTDISCRLSGISSPVNPNDAEEQRQTLARIADSLTVSSPASSLLQPAGRSMSILSSVCALLLNKQGSHAAKEVSSFTGSLRSDNICRICFGGESAERLVRPCSCRGTIAAVHRTCLERWLLQAATSYCELCRHHYVVTRSHKWSWMRSMLEWAMSGRGRALAADMWRALALGTASVLGTARALHACDAVLQAGARRGVGAALVANLFSSLLIGVIGALNGLLTTWMLLKVQEHQLSWQAWRDSTLHVHVSLGDEDSTVTQHTSDVTVVGDEDGNATADRSTNVADPFMGSLPFNLRLQKGTGTTSLNPRVQIQVPVKHPGVPKGNRDQSMYVRDYKL